MLELMEEKYNWCPLGLSDIPNAEIIASMEASDRGEGVKNFKSMKDLFKDLRMSTGNVNKDGQHFCPPQKI
jgi:hypothetical protein